jgi:hypothetical protein
MRLLRVLSAVFAVCVFLPATAGARPDAHAAATCSQYSNQAAAQRAADTRDADGDGVYCESLPCPCARPGRTHTTHSAPVRRRTGCSLPHGVQSIRFTASRYPNIREHMLDAIRKGWPSTLVLNRPGASQRRDRLLEDIPTRHGYDRDEYPPAVGRGRANGDLRSLVRGIDPRGWLADVEYVPSAENRSHGSSMGSKLRHFCNGTRFRYVFS